MYIVFTGVWLVCLTWRALQRSQFCSPTGWSNEIHNIHLSYQTLDLTQRRLIVWIPLTSPVQGLVYFVFVLTFTATRLGRLANRLEQRSGVVVENIHLSSRTLDLTRRRLIVWIPLTSRIRGLVYLAFCTYRLHGPPFRCVAHKGRHWSAQ